MKENKYRAWDKVYNRYVPHKFFNQLFLRQDGHVIWYSHSGFEDVTDKFEIEFFIGLKDKNSVEACEGDIVKKIVNNGVIQKYRKDDIEKVEISPYGANPCAYYDCDCGESEKGEYWEVIGNINENPELLK